MFTLCSSSSWLSVFTFNTNFVFAITQDQLYIACLDCLRSSALTSRPPLDSRIHSFWLTKHFLFIIIIIVIIFIVFTILTIFTMFPYATCLRFTRKKRSESAGRSPVDKVGLALKLFIYINLSLHFLFLQTIKKQVLSIKLTKFVCSGNLGTWCNDSSNCCKWFFV